MNHEMPAAGAILARLMPKPLYSPLHPSCCRTCQKQSTMPLYGCGLRASICIGRVSRLRIHPVRVLLMIVWQDQTNCGAVEPIQSIRCYKELCLHLENQLCQISRFCRGREGKIWILIQEINCAQGMAHTAAERDPSAKLLDEVVRQKDHAWSRVLTRPNG